MVFAQHLDLSPVAITAFLEGTCHELSRNSRPIRFIPQPGLDDLLIMVDRRRLLQVVVNTSTNSAKYADGLTAITLDSVPGGVEIGLEDDGPGVAPEERQLIFERFARGASAGNRGSDSGTGLGLALVSEHVGLHGGRIWVEDARHSPTGARFVCFFPSPTMSLLDDPQDDDEFVEMPAGVAT